MQGSKLLLLFCMRSGSILAHPVVAFQLIRSDAELLHLGSCGTKRSPVLVLKDCALGQHLAVNTVRTTSFQLFNSSHSCVCWLKEHGMKM